MDPFTPIQVDPNPDERPTDWGRPSPAPTGVPAGKPDLTDVALAAAHNLVLLGAIERQIDQTTSGAAEVTGIAGFTGPLDEPIATRGDPLDDSNAPHIDPASGGDGCFSGAFALLLTFTLAAGTAMAIFR